MIVSFQRSFRRLNIHITHASMRIPDPYPKVNVRSVHPRAVR